MAATKGAQVWPCPVKTCQPQQALDGLRRLPERHAAQRLHLKTNSDCRVAGFALATALGGVAGAYYFTSTSNQIDSQSRSLSGATIVLEPMAHKWPTVRRPVPDLLHRRGASACTRCLPTEFKQGKPHARRARKGVSGKESPYRLRSRRALMGWKATPTCASQ
jgi:hypothetical protein